MKSSKMPTKLSKSVQMIMLCWLVYACSYIGKLSYNANIEQIETAFSVSHANAGMVSTFFFFAYGIGQVVNGILCKRYNIKYVIFGSLTVASAMNLAIVLVPSFAAMKYFWLLNGVAMSFLWTSLIRLISETVPKSEMSRAIVAMGTTVATGTFLVYGMSALFVATVSYKATFIVAAVLMIIVSFVWLIRFDSLAGPLREERRLDMPASTAGDVAKSVTHSGDNGGVILLVGVLALFAIANNFVKDGLTAWTPNILKSLYNTPPWLSILLTLLLPMLAIFGTVVAVNMQKRVKSFVGTCTLLFLGTTVLTGIVILLLSTQLLPVTIACFGIVSCLMAGVNNVITSMVPLYMKEKTSSGMLAGVLNGFCYLGSTVSSYGLGAVADRWGWPSVFTVLISVSVFVIIIGSVYLLCNRIRGVRAA